MKVGSGKGGSVVRTAAELTPEERMSYRLAAQLRERQAAVRPEILERQRRAWELARRAAALLRERFAVRRVVVFGSLVHKGCFTPWSDVDLAVWGLRPEETFRAMGAVWALDPEIEVDLVDVNACSPALLAVIEREGVEL